MTAALPVGDGRYTVPGNRWDLLPTPTRPPRVSVIVPFYDQQAQLERLLVGIELQTGPVDVVEVVVGDDGSPAPPHVPGWYDGPPVHIVRQQDLGVRPAAARNLAAASATGEVLAFLDGDMVPGPDYLAAVSALPAVAPEALVVGTRHHHDLTDCTPERIRGWLTGTADAPPRLDDPTWLDDGYRRTDHLLDLDHRSYQWVIGAVTTMAASLFHEVGGYDHTIDVYGGEDWDLAYRAVQAGAIVAHVDAVAHHDGPNWRVRVGATGTKNPERLALVHRIPSLDDGIVTAEPLVDVAVDVHGWDPDLAVATVTSTLRASRSGLRVTVSRSDRHVSRLLAHDPRVVLGPAAPSSPRTALRCRLAAPVEVTAGAFHRLLDATAPGTPGRVRVGDDDGELLVAASARVLARAQRWAGCGLDADVLFGSPRQVDGTAVGITRRRGPLDLADLFPR